jgi:3-oxoacyl-[acyl-carrier protein] reductase
VEIVVNKIDLAGRVAVVTGGASGLGLAVARRCLSSGADVVLWDLNAETLSRAAAELSALGKVDAATLDVTDYAAIERAAGKIGKIDILVNSAGINRPPTPIAAYPLRDWHDIIAIDLTGVFFTCRAVIPGMVARGYGRIVSIASIAGKEGNPLMPAYAAAKAGVIGLTKSLGKELGATGVIVNAIAPTIIDTPMNRKTSAAAPDVAAQLLAKIPLGRRGTVEELAAMATWLASEECSFTTGFTFDLSGGRATY